MATLITVKVAYGTEMRRFSMTQNKLTWPSLSEKVAGLFEFPSETKIVLSYVDEEGDRITMSSEDELAEAVSLALAKNPAVLRLAVEMTKGRDKKSKQRNADAKPTTGTETGTGVPDEVRALLGTLGAQLPALLAQLPDGVRRLIPNAELDLAATIAANAAANASCAAAQAASAAAAAASSEAADGAHVGVTCDKSGMCPIVGMRYHLVGHNYDLCQAEYDKLDEKEKVLFQAIPPPFVANLRDDAAAADGPSSTTPKPSMYTGVHPGVECDKSGMCPIVGIRYNLVGHDYDLCQAEYDKLDDKEKVLYRPIPPPHPHGNGGGAHPFGGRMPAFACGGFGGGGRPMPRGFGFGGGGGGCGRGGNHHGANWRHKLSARFVRDVSIFDGTQMAPATKFTKIWRLKNEGELAWPAGTRILFVGGDQMTSEVSVPLSRDGPVPPGAEVDVAVEMEAPSELGRYLGYWRLVCPENICPFGGRRACKFGQRVWCHVQVVDPAAASALELPSEDDLKRTADEIEQKKSALVAADADADDGESPLPVGVPVRKAGDDEAAATGDAAAAVPQDETLAAKQVVEAEGGDVSDGGSFVDVSERDLADDAEEKKITAAAAAASSSSGNGSIEQVKGALAAMGFDNDMMVGVVLGKHGADLDACAADLAAATEWESSLDDLEEMGFTNRELNKSLMLKHDGNVKRTVKALVEDA